MFSPFPVSEQRRNDNQEGRLHSLGRRVLEPRELLGTTELADLGNWYQSPGVGIIDQE